MSKTESATTTSTRHSGRGPKAMWTHLVDLAVFAVGRAPKKHRCYMKWLRPAGLSVCCDRNPLLVNLNPDFFLRSSSVSLRFLSVFLVLCILFFFFVSLSSFASSLKPDLERTLHQAIFLELLLLFSARVRFQSSQFSLHSPRFPYSPQFSLYPLHPRLSVSL